MTSNSAHKELTHIVQAIYDKKGFNIIVLDVRPFCMMTDYFVIAEGTVDRHVKALAREVTDELAPLGRRPFHVDGEREGDWVVLDYGDIMIHLFIPELRQKYALEQLWKKGSIVDVPIEIAKPYKASNEQERS